MFNILDNNLKNSKLRIDNNNNLLVVDSTLATATGLLALESGGNLADVKTSVELIDDTVMVMGTDNYSEAVSKGLLIGAVRNNTLASLASSNKDITPLQVDADGALYISSTSLTDIETNTNYGLVVGGGVEASALRVTLASDSTGVLTVDNAGAFSVDVGKVPTIGSQGNLSNAVLTAIPDEKSSVVNTIYTPNISVFGDCSDNCTITLQTSIDNVNFYNTTYSYTSAGGDFYFNAVSSGQYHRLNYSASGLTVTASLCAV